MKRDNLRRLLVDERGQDLIEYALIAGFVSLLCVGNVQCLGMRTTFLYWGFGNSIQSIPGG